jgi:alpha/beta superfamily hydrolase
MKKILGILCFASCVNVALANTLIGPPGDEEQQYDRWRERLDYVHPLIQTDATMDWSKLDVTVWWQKKPAPYIIFLHGSDGSLREKKDRKVLWDEELKILFYSMGLHVVELSHRGYGESEGSFSEYNAALSSISPSRPEGDDANYIQLLSQDRAKDVTPVIKWLDAQTNVQGGGILLGHSFGGVVSMHLADQASSIKGVINIAGGLGKGGKDPSKKGEMEDKQLKTFLNIVHTTKPNLLIYAKNDSVIDIALGKNIFNYQNKISKSKLIVLDLEKNNGNPCSCSDPHSLLVGKAVKNWQEDAYQFLSHDVFKN